MDLVSLFSVSEKDKRKKVSPKSLLLLAWDEPMIAIRLMRNIIKASVSSALELTFSNL